MAILDGSAQHSGSGFARFWHRMPALFRAIVLGFFVTISGTFTLPLIASLVPGLGALVVMGVLLFLYWKFFSGSWGPKATAEARRNYFRAAKMSPVVRKWALVAVILFVVVFQSSLMLTFRFIEFPAESFTAEYAFDTLPLWVAWVAIILSALVAGICEETGFRGYGQVPLEERYGPVIAIVIVSLLFVAVHLHQAWSPPILLHIFAGGMLFGILAYTSSSLIPGIIAHTITDIFNFSYWWSDVAGKFEYETIAETGIDAHLIAWLLIFAASTILFFWTIRKIRAARLQSLNGQ